jgi:hypothetical protein
MFFEALPALHKEKKVISASCLSGTRYTRSEFTPAVVEDILREMVRLV